MEKYPLPTTRELALNILQGVENRKGYSNYLLNEAYQKYPLTNQEKALLKEIVGGVLRQRGKLDWALNKLTEQRLKKSHPMTRNILRLGAYQLLFLGGVASYAAVNESVNLARKFGYRGSTGLVNAVLRRLSQEKESFHFPGLEEGPLTFISVNYSHPEWLVKRWLTRWGAHDTISICQANNQAPVIGLRVNTLKVTLEDCQKHLQREGIVTRPGFLTDETLEVESGLDLTNCETYKNGWVEIQSPTSILVSQVLAPQPGEQVLDLCAGRGVKSTHLAQLMKNQGEIIAVDIHPHKLKQLENNCHRLGIDIIKTISADASLELPFSTSLKFDRILLDAPCSGLGVIGRYPESRWLKKPALIDEMQKLQEKLLGQAAAYLSKEGTLVYATCSLEPEENELVIEDFLQKNPEWQLLPIKIDSDIKGKPGLYWRSRFHQQAKGSLLLEDGFFIAKLGHKMSLQL